MVWEIWEDRRDISWETFATTAWCIWKNRNATKFEGRSKAGKIVAREAELLVEEFSSTNIAVPHSTATRNVKWMPLCEGGTK